MTRHHILLLSLGPVQGLVRAARKARDAWGASDLLSTWVLRTAEACRKAGLDVVVPVPGATTAANKLVLQVADPAAAGRRATEIARDTFRELAEQVLRDAILDKEAELADVVNRALWDRQVITLPEVYWAAAPIEHEDQWGAAREQAEAALAARKHTRDFLPWVGEAGVDKASVDGQWEGVLREGAAERIRKRRGLGRIGAKEVLDLAGVLRRFWQPDAARVPSALDVATVVFLAGQKRRGEIERLASDVGLDVGELLLGSPATWDKENDPPNGRSWKEIAAQRAGLVRGTPPAYYAVIVADGDRVGRALSALRTRPEHEDAARALSRLALEVKGIAQEYPGAEVIYAGGDDAMIFAPVVHALGIAEDLRRLAEGTHLAGGPLGLTVAVAVAHVHDSLRGAIELARRAERAGKRDGGGRLVVTIDPRGGSSTEAIVPWADDPKGWFDDAAAWLAAGEVPAGLGYELLKLGKDLGGLKGPTLHREVRRVLGRKRDRAGDQVDPERVERLIALVPGAPETRSEDALEGLKRLETRLRIAQFFHRHRPRTQEAPAP